MTVHIHPSPIVARGSTCTPSERLNVAVAGAQGVALVPFTAELLLLVRPWFSHPEVQHRLGGPDWPERELRLMTENPGSEYRGARVLRCHSWVAMNAAGEPVGKVGGDVYDHWTVWDGSRPDHPIVTATKPGPAMGLYYIVDPARWRQGYGTALLRAATAHHDVTDVRLFAAGIDADNDASRRCAATAGFTPDREEPDWEGTVYYLLERHRPRRSPQHRRSDRAQPR